MDLLKFLVRMFYVYSFVIMVLLVFILSLVNESSSNYSSNILSSSSPNSDSVDCYGLNLPMTVGCINSFVNTIYKYNSTNDNIVLSFDELKSRGGDCKDWSDYYISELAKYNFTSESMIIPVDDDSSHMIVVVYDSTGYCNIDQRRFVCYDYKDN